MEGKKVRHKMDIALLIFGIVFAIAFVIVSYHQCGELIHLSDATDGNFTAGKVFCEGTLNLKKGVDDEIFPVFNQNEIYRLVLQPGGKEVCLVRRDVATGKEENLCAMERENGFFSGMQISGESIYLSYTEMKEGKAVNTKVYQYAEENKTPELIGTLHGDWRGKGYGVWGETIYHFTGFEGCTLDNWTDANGFCAILENVYGEIDQMVIHDGIVAMQNEARTRLIRYDVDKMQIIDQIQIGEKALPSYVQANERYAVWIDEGQAYAFDYEDKELFRLGAVSDPNQGDGLMESRIMLFDEKLYILEEKEMVGYDLEKRCVERKDIKWVA